MRCVYIAPSYVGRSAVAVSPKRCTVGIALLTCAYPYINMTCHLYTMPNQRALLIRLYLLGARLLRLGTLQHGIRIAYACQIALLHALERKCGNQRSANTRSILSRHDLHRVVAAPERLAVAAGRPVEDLLQGLSAASLCYT